MCAQTNISKIEDISDLTTIQNEITSFTEKSEHLVNLSQDIVKFDSNEDPYTKQTLIGFLQRPVNILDTPWLSSHPIDEMLVDVACPINLFNIGAYARKLANFKYIRCGLRFGLRVNGTKFHYGKLMVSWKPSHTFAMMDPINDNVYSNSCYPHIIVSATESEVHEFIVPYCLPWKYMDIGSIDRCDMGSLQVLVLNPLRVTTAATPDISITLFMNLENVEIAGMTSVVYNPVRAQAELQEISEKSTKGIVAGVLESITGVAGSLKKVSTLSAPMFLVEQVCSALGKTARNLGLCKPNDISLYAPRILRNFLLAHSHGVETAPMLSLSPTNQVVVDYSLVGSHDKEMSIAYLTQTHSLVAIQTWSNNSSSVLFQLPLSPSYCYTTLVEAKTTIFPTILAWTTAPFEFWRGGLKVGLQITCSAFHSGRLRVVWEPEENAAIPPGPLLQPLAQCVNHIIDIQTETEFYFTVPYLRDIPWLTNGTMNVQGQSNGKIMIQVLNKLTHPETPVPPVYVNVWLSAAEDFQVAMPSLEQLPYDIADSPVKAQGVTREMMRERNHAALISPTTLEVDYNILMGEQVTHIKDVTNRPSYQWLLKQNINGGWRVIIPSFPIIEVFRSYKDWYSAIFRYARGSVTYKIIAQPGTTKAGLPITIPDIYIQSYPNPNRKVHESVLGQALLTNGLATNLCFTNNAPVCEGTVPYYAQTYNFINTYNSSPADFDVTCPSLLVHASIQGPAIDEPALSPRVGIYSSTGEDYLFGFQVAPPVITYRSLTT